MHIMQTVEQALTNRIYCHPEDALSEHRFVEVGVPRTVYEADVHPDVPHNTVWLGNIQRKNCRLACRDDVDVVPFLRGHDLPVATEIRLSIRPFRRADADATFVGDVTELFAPFDGHIFRLDQDVACRSNDGKLWIAKVLWVTTGLPAVFDASSTTLLMLDDNVNNAPLEQP